VPHTDVEDRSCELDVTEMSGTDRHTFITLQAIVRTSRATRARAFGGGGGGTYSGALERPIDRPKMRIIQALFPRLEASIVLEKACQRHDTKSPPQKQQHTIVSGYSM
jgi:hypothetical protein